MIVKEVYLENMSVPIIINYTQGTNNIPIRFKFMDIKLSTSQRVFLYADKVSGNKIYNEAEEVNANEGYAVFAVTNQMSAEAGRNVMQLRITEHEKVINSFLILFDVASGIYDEDAILSTNEYKALDQALDSAREWENAAEKSATEAKKYSDNAGVYATNAKTSELNAKTSELNAKTSEVNAKVSETNAKTSETNALASESNASASASSAKISETNAKTSETAAKASEVNASVSEANALEYSNNSSDSANASESSAVTSSTYASYSENSAKAAKSSEDKAFEYSIVANNSAEEAKSSENNAREHSKDASGSAEESMSYALQAQSYAVGTGGVRDNESEDNSKFYSEKSKEYMNTWKGSLLPKGSVAFENLPTNNIMPGYLYNISNRFVSDDRFKDGTGYSYPAGTNIYYTEDGKWDVLYGILTKEITQAEYDALSESQKKNGTIYYIKDADVEIGSASDSVPGVVVVDSVLSSSSKNPVQNKVVTEELNRKANSIHTHDDRYYTESEVDSKISDINNSISSHTSNTSNPHGVTKAQVGLGNVENKSSATIRGEITKSNVTTALGYTPLNQSLKGSASGLAELDSNGKVPSSQLPSYVDDVVEGYLSSGKFYKESAHTTEISGETGKIYIDLSTEKTYRWSGSAFVVISETLALGETSSTAYRGDRGKTAYDHSQSTHARTDATKVEKSSTNGNIKINGTETTVYTHPSGTNPHGTTKSDVGLGNVDNTSDIDKPVSTAQQEKFTELNRNLDALGYSEIAGGKNIWDEQWENGVYNELDGIFNPISNYFCSKNKIKVKPNTIYRFVSPEIYHYIYKYDVNGNYIGRLATVEGVFPTDNNVEYIQFVMETDYGATYNHDIAIIEGTSGTYEPYIPSVKMLADENIQQSNSIVDMKMLGWSVPKECPIQNEVSGNQFIQKVGRVDLGTLTWLKYTPVSGVFMTSYSDLKINGYIYADGFVYYTPSWIESSPNKCIAIHPSLTNIYIKDTTYTDVESFKNSVIGKYAYYELATPITMTIDGNEVTERINGSLDDFVRFKSITQAEYDKLTSPESNVIYFITDAS